MDMQDVSNEQIAHYNADQDDIAMVSWCKKQIDFVSFAENFTL